MSVFDSTRFRERLSAAGVSQSELARRLDLSQGAIAKLAAGNAYGSKHLHRIARELGTTPAYLTGETDDPEVGAMLTPSARDLAEHLGLAMIPQVDMSLSMGGGSFLEDTPAIEMVPFRADWLRRIAKGRLDQLALTRGVGDSMFPTMVDDDDVIFDTSQNTINQQDRIWAMAYSELGVIKRVRKLPGGGYQLNSDNASVTPIHVDDGEMHVIGRVVWIGRRM